MLNADKRLLEEFSGSDWFGRADLANQFGDDRLKQLGQRLVFLNASSLVSQARRTAAEAAIMERWQSNDPDAPWTTTAEVEKQLVEIRNRGAMTDEEIAALRRFYRDRLAKVAR